MTGATEGQVGRWFEDRRGEIPAALVVLAADGAVAVSNPEALELLACANSGELRALLQPIVKRLDASSSGSSVSSTERFEFQVPGERQARRIVLSARRLGGDQLRWLLLLQSDHQSREFETTLQHAARNQLLQRLQGTMRHDLNSPIQAALWTFDLLQRALQQSPVNPEQKAQLEESTALGRKELARLKDAVRRFLSFAASPGGDRERLDACELVSDIQRMISPEASLREVAMTIDLPSEAIFVEGVRNQLEQALATLMINAVDHTPPGGTIRTSVAQHDGRLEIAISSLSPAGDSARGPPPAEPATQNAIGLHAARSIMMSHGGDVSQLPGGPARIDRVRLPLARGKSPSL